MLGQTLEDLKMNNIIPFDFEGRAVRSTVIDGEPWFIAADICRVLGVQNPSDAVAKLLDDDERGVASIYTPSGDQKMLIVNESGLYTLILRSRSATKPGTPQHRFRKWVTSEVLPSIRKTGGYNGDASPTDPQHPYSVREVIVRPNGQWGCIWAIPVYRINGVDYWNVSLVLEAYSGQRELPDCARIDIADYARDLMKLHPELVGAAPFWVAHAENFRTIIGRARGCWDNYARQFMFDLTDGAYDDRDNKIVPLYHSTGASIR
jgi:prophage antirepressor-like protein